MQRATLSYPVRQTAQPPSPGGGRDGELVRARDDARVRSPEPDAHLHGGREDEQVELLGVTRKEDPQISQGVLDPVQVVLAV